MAKQEYEVIRAWVGVEVGQVVKLEEPVHPALKANVRKVGKVTKGDAVAAAQAEAEAIVQAARMQADQIVAEAHAAAAELGKAKK